MSLLISKECSEQWILQMLIRSLTMVTWATILRICLISTTVPQPTSQLHMELEWTLCARWNLDSFSHTSQSMWRSAFSTTIRSISPFRISVYRGYWTDEILISGEGSRVWKLLLHCLVQGDGATGESLRVQTSLWCVQGRGVMVRKSQSHLRHLQVPDDGDSDPG